MNLEYFLMKRFIYLFFLFFFLISGFPYVSQSMELLEDLERWCAEICISQGRSFNKQLLYSSKIIENNRFFSPLTTSFDPAFPPHSQSISLTKPYCFPENALEALLQYLFPSPDGAILIANQTGETVGKLDPFRIGQLLKRIEDKLRGSPDETTFKLTLYDLLLKSESPSQIDKYDRLLKELPEFYLYDLKINLLQRVESWIGSVEEEEIKKAKISPQDPLILTNYLHYILSKTCSEHDFFGSGLLKEGELESYKAAADLDSSDSKSDLSQQLSYFKNKEKEFKTLRFVEVLVTALEEQRQKKEGTSESLVERAVFFFFWQKAKTPNDIVNFFSGYLEVAPEVLSPTFPTTVFSEQKYWKVRNNPDALKEALSNPKQAFLLHFGYDLFENPLPLLLQYQTAFYMRNSFPDCIENLFSNFLDSVCRMKKSELANPGSQKQPSQEETVLNVADESVSELQATVSPGHVFKALFLKEGHFIHAYYTWLNENPELRFSQERRDRMASFCSGLPNVRYLKSTHGKGGIKDYELAPGFINFLKFSHSFFGEPSSEFLLFEENKERVLEELDKLCTFLSRENFKLTCERENLSYNSLKNDYFGTLTFLINGKDAFVFTMEPIHGYIKQIVRVEEDWRQKIDIEALQKTLPPEILGSFLTPETYKKICSTLSGEDQITLTHSLDLDSVEMKCAVVEAAYTQQPLLIPFSRGLMGSIADLQDRRASAALLRVLMPFLTKDSPLRDEDMLDFFKRSPDLIGVHFHDPFHPLPHPADTINNQLSFFALEQGKDAWLNLAIPRVDFLSLNVCPNLETVQMFLETQLPKCKELETLSLCLFQDEKRASLLHSFLSALAHLKNLSMLRLNSFPLNLLKSTLENLPPSLETFYCNVKTEDEGRCPDAEKLKEIVLFLPLFFEKYPTITFELEFYVYGKKEIQDKIKEIFNVSSFPPDKFILKF